MIEQLSKEELQLLAKAALYLPSEWKKDRDRYVALSEKLKRMAETTE